MVKKYDNELIEAFLAGDTSAFTQIYDSNYKPVYYTCYYYVRNHETAEDLTQEVFTIVYNNLNQLQSPEAFRTWLRKIIHSTCTRFLENKTNQLNETMILVNEGYIENSDGEFEDPQNFANKEILNTIILKIVQELPEQQRTVAELRFYDEYSIKEISTILEIPEGTVKSRLNILRDSLKGELSKRDITPNTYFSMLSPGVIMGAFANWNNLIEQSAGFKNIIPFAPTNPTSPVPLVVDNKYLRSEFIIPLTIIGLGIGGTSLMLINDVKDKSTIKNVEYSTAFQCGQVPVEVKLSNAPAMTSLVLTAGTTQIQPVLDEGVYTFYVEENGSYSLVLTSEDESTVTKLVEINSIDCNAPSIIELATNLEESVLQVDVEDDLSGIDVETTYLLINNTKYMPEYDELTKKLTFKVDLNQTFEATLHIQDIAGNWNESDVSYAPEN